MLFSNFLLPNGTIPASNFKTRFEPSYLEKCNKISLGPRKFGFPLETVDDMKRATPDIYKQR